MCIVLLCIDHHMLLFLKWQGIHRVLTMCQKLLCPDPILMVIELLIGVKQVSFLSPLGIISLPRSHLLDLAEIFILRPLFSNFFKFIINVLIGGNLTSLNHLLAILPHLPITLHLINDMNITKVLILCWLIQIESIC